MSYFGIFIWALRGGLLLIFFYPGLSIQTTMRNGQRETIQLCLIEKLKKSEISFVESNPDWRNTYDVCPTECEMQKDPSCNVNKSFGVASIEVKGGGSTAEDSISSKCEMDWVIKMGM